MKGIKLSSEQERLLIWLKAGAGSQSKSSVHSCFSSATIKSLLNRHLIRDDWTKGYYSIGDIGGLVS